MNEFSKTLLEDVLYRPISGSRPKGGVSFEGDIPSLGGENITMNGGLKLKKVKKISFEFFESMKKGQLKNLDVLINKDGANTGKSSIYRNSPFLNAAVNEHLFILRGKEGKLDQEYLHHLLQFSEVKAILEKKITGSAQPGINTTFIKNFPIYLAPLPEQKKIAYILNSVEELIKNTQKQIEKLQDLKKGTMNELLTKGIGNEEFKETKLGPIPKNWEIKNLSDLCTLHYGRSPKKIEDNDGIYPIYGTGGIVGKTNTTLHKGDSIILGRKGSINNVSFADSPFWAIDTTYYIDCKNVEIKWLFYRLQFEELEKYNEASGVPSLNRDTLYNIPIQIPSDSEQRHACVILNALDSQINSLSNKLHHIQFLKNALMQDLLTGKIRMMVNT